MNKSRISRQKKHQPYWGVLVQAPLEKKPSHGKQMFHQRKNDGHSSSKAAKG